ncbi:MAG: hypothetical protein PWP31_1262 [Clostridia bacterium]|nr:hypothetical protein [Clostridia bacterium]
MSGNEVFSMQCHKAREFFSPYLDGELSSNEIEQFKQHLDTCPACMSELNEWKKISHAIQGLKSTVKAPPGLAMAINKQIEAEKKKSKFSGAKRWMATAAAVFALITGSVSYVANGFWNNLPFSVAIVEHQNGQSQQQTGIGEPQDTQVPVNNNSVNNNDNTGIENQQPGSKITPGKNPVTNNTQPPATPNDTAKPTPNNNGGTVITNGQPAQVAANTEEYTAMAFLSNEHQKTNTMMKVAVNDLDTAGSKVENLVNNNGLSFSNIASQENKKIYQIVIPKDKADVLIADLANIGQVTAKNTNIQDLNEQFASTLEQYQAKIAQANVTTDAKEKEELIQEAKALENQLKVWEKESKQQIIVLWLETE